VVERGVWSPVIVGPQPAAEGSAALGVGAIQPGVGPLLQQGAVEPLHLAVELLWSSGHVGGLGAGEHGLEDDVGQPPLKAPQGFALGLALGLLAGPGGDPWRLPGGLGGGPLVQGTVEPAVAATIETVAVGPAGGDRDGRGALRGRT